MTARLDQLEPGDAVAELVLPPVTASDLHLYAEASGDRNPLHLDRAVAARAGQPDVVAHGMLLMAWLGRHVQDLAGATAVRSLSTRFLSPAHPNDVVTCAGRVERIEVEGDGRVLHLELSATTSDGRLLANGAAVVAVNS